MIQGMFGTPARFGLMVRNGYPMVWRPAEVEFLSVEERGSDYLNLRLTIEVINRQHLARVIRRLRRIDMVERIARINQ